MARRLAPLLLLILACSAFAQESYIGLFMQGQRIGYVESKSEDETVGGQALKRMDTKTIIRAGLLGDSMTVTLISQSWTDEKGSPKLMKFLMDSAGRSQRTEASFTSDAVHVAIDNNGATTKKKLAIPKDAKIVDDAMMSLLDEGVPAGTARTYYVLDPTTATLVKNTAKLVGPAKAKVNGKEFDSTLVEIAEPRATMKLFVSSKGDLIKAEGLAGIEMIPITKEEALSLENGPAPKIDLAAMTKIRTDKPLGDLDVLASSKLKFSNVNLAKAPSDVHQTVTGKNSVWTVALHPVVADRTKAATISAAARQKPAFLKQGLNIPCATGEFKGLAKQILGPTTNVVDGAKKIHKYVHGLMRPNAGIGVLRDASEVLKTKEGVCRDYAILTATLLRAGNIPARLASGLVFAEGDFYYHAWTEFWDGKRWVGLDTTRPSGKVTAGHVKLAHGSVEEAFLFTFLDKARVQVLNLKRRSA